MKKPKVTILIPNYKTLQLTKLCLRLIRKNTCQDEVKVIVIDNNSQDDSLDYLRTLNWIQLIERKVPPNESAVSAHAHALDLGLAQVSTPYVLSMHTDTLIKHAGWLQFLLAQFAAHSNVAGVGSWKLESKPLWRRTLKRGEHYLQLAFYSAFRKQHKLAGVGKNYYYLRSHFAMYRMDVIEELKVNFADGDMVAGKFLHKKIVDAGYKMLFLPSERLGHYVEHINHATTVLNPELNKFEKSVKKGLKRIEKSLTKMNASEILQDASLDF